MTTWPHFCLVLTYWAGYQYKDICGIPVALHSACIFDLIQIWEIQIQIVCYNTRWKWASCSDFWVLLLRGAFGLPSKSCLHNHQQCVSSHLHHYMTLLVLNLTVLMMQTQLFITGKHALLEIWLLLRNCSCDYIVYWFLLCVCSDLSDQHPAISTLTQRGAQRAWRLWQH